MTDFQSRVQQPLAGNYTLERKLGGGGMSKVFVAHEHSSGLTVVVMPLAPELAAECPRPASSREIRVAAQRMKSRRKSLAEVAQACMSTARGARSHVRTVIAS